MTCSVFYFLGQIEVAKVLIAKGADISAKTSYNRTAICMAYEKGKVQVFGIIMKT